MIKTYAPWLVVLVAVLGLLCEHFKPTPAIPVGIYTATKDSVAVAGLEKQVVAGTRVRALPPAAKQKLGMPQDVQNDPNKHVVDTAQFPITYQPFTAVATYDAQTDEVIITAKNDPLPWLAAESRWYARTGYGVKSRAGKVWQLAVGGNLIQTKALHMGGSVELFTDGDGYAGIHIEYQF